MTTIFMKKTTFVEAFQLGLDTMPEWFEDMIDQWYIDDRTEPPALNRGVFDMRENTGLFNLNGVITELKPGTMIVRHVNQGKIEIMTPVKFHKNYLKL